MSETLERLRAAIGQPPVERDTSETYDLALARTLPHDERELFASELATRVRLGDTRAMMTLADLGGPWARASLEPMALVESEIGHVARRALAALGGIDAASPALPLLVGDLRGGPMMVRFGAAMALERVGVASVEVVDALLATCDADDSALRAKAFEVLLGITGLRRFAMKPDGSDLELRSPLMVVETAIRSRLKALRTPALAELHHIVSALRAGEPAEGLGLTYASDANGPDLSGLGRTLFQNPQPYPLDAVRAARGHDRRYAEVLTAKSLERHLTKVPMALAELGARWTAPVMQEAAQEPAASDAFRLEVDKALAHLAA